MVKKGEDELKCFEEMKLKGVSLDVITFACSWKASACIGALSRGIEIHGEIEKTGLIGRDSIVGNALVDRYEKCGYLSKAEELLYSFCKRDVISWNALIAGYVKYKQDEAVLNSLEKMQVEGISPDSITLAYVLKACGSIGAGEKGTKIHIEMDRKILLEQSFIIGNALMNMYAKCGLLMKAREVFDKISDADIILWNVLIAWQAQFSQCEDVIHVLDTMETVGVNLDSPTFLSVLHACNHGGHLFKAQIFFEAMIQDYGIAPTTEHYTSMIDLFSRVGQVDNARETTFKAEMYRLKKY